VTAASGLRHCDLNDLWQAVERPSSRSRIVVVTTALLANSASSHLPTNVADITCRYRKVSPTNVLDIWCRLSYFGPASGVLRYHPDITWSSRDSGSAASYDHRSRQWYQQAAAATSHNNVVLLLVPTSRHRSVGGTI